MSTAYGLPEKEGTKKDEIEIQKYSINLMWVREDIEGNEKLPYITKHTSQMAFEFDFLVKIQKWKKENPQASVNIWYDGNYVTKEQIEATQKFLDIKSGEDPSFNLQLKDVRDIPIVKQNPDAFSSIDVYQKVDILKPIICLYEIENEGNDAAIFSDLDVGEEREKKDRMNKQELFDPPVEDEFRRNDPSYKTFKETFQSYGYIQNLNKYAAGIENQFLQVLNKPQTLQALKIYINHVLETTVNALNLEWDIPDEDNEANKAKTLTDLSGLAFEKQHLLFSLILSYPNIQVKDPGSGDWVDFDPEKHKIFGNFHDRDECRNTLEKANGLMDMEKKLPIYSVEGNIVKSRDDIKSIGNTVKFSNYFKLENYASAIVRDCDVRVGHDHGAKFSDLTVMPPAEGITYKVKLMPIAPKAKTLIDKRADTNVKANDNMIPLSYAIQEEKEMDLAAVKKRARIYTKAIKQAILKGDNKVFLRILENGFDINAKLDFQSYGWNMFPLLTHAIFCDAKESVYTLIDKGADINAKADNGMTPLLCAVYDRQKEIALALIEKGADINAKVKDGMTPLLYAAKRGEKEVALALIEKGADINAKTTKIKDMTPLLYAIKGGLNEFVLMLIEKGADINAKADNGQTPLFYAMAEGRDELVTMLIEGGRTSTLKLSPTLMMASSLLYFMP